MAKIEGLKYAPLREISYLKFYFHSSSPQSTDKHNLDDVDCIGQNTQQEYYKISFVHLKN